MAVSSHIGGIGRIFAVVAVVGATAAEGGSLRFTANGPAQYEFADIPKLPARFGRGEFTFEMWIKPDQTFPFGDADSASYDQLKVWTTNDPQPYSSNGWWITGNWLLDGHTRPEGFGGGDTREGTFSLNFYGGGRLRWMFADKKDGMPKGMVYAVQVWPAKDTPSLVDGKWHHVATVRRWREPSGATLELWVDGVKLATTDIPDRTNMRKYWDNLAHPKDPKHLGGWALGAEVMTAWNYAYTQFEDYKGLVDEIRMWDRALEPAEIQTAARGDGIKNLKSLLSHFTFEEKAGRSARDALDPESSLILHRWSAENWSRENSPAK